MTLEERIDKSWNGDLDAEAVLEVLELLDSGKLRVATKEAAGSWNGSREGGWNTPMSSPSDFSITVNISCWILERGQRRGAGTPPGLHHLISQSP